MKIPGVSYRHNAKVKKWRARIIVDGKKIELGSFETMEKAARARRLAEEKYRGASYRSLKRKIDKK